MSAVRSPAPEQQPTPERISLEEYLQRERLAPFRSEYVRGYIFAMSGAKPIHNIISFNVGGELHIRLKGKSCTGYTNDQKVEAGTSDAVFYPDILVVCGEPVYREGTDDVIANPTLVVEVESPSTASYDKGKKFQDYAELDSLKDYLIVSTRRRQVQHYARQDNGQWLVTFYADPQASVPLPALGIELPLSGIYDRTKFDAAAV